MVGANMLVCQALGLLGGVVQNALALMAERQVHRRRSLLARHRAALYFLMDRFQRRVGAEKTVGQGLVFAQQPEQQVFALDVRTAALAGFIAREEDDPAGLFGVALKH